MKLISETEKVIATQDYSKPVLIEGVKVVELKRFTTEDGAFNEVVRIKQGKVEVPEELAGFETAQINHSLLIPGTVKAWHLHFLQDEIWFIHPESSALVGLLDVRLNSPTSRLSMRLGLGRGKAYLIFIPRGVAHGLANFNSSPLTMTYLVNRCFDVNDEKRLPYDFGVEKDFWQLKKG